MNNLVASYASAARLICVEGNIASGKTTFLRNVRRIAPRSIQTVPEPLHKWRKLHGENILNLLYQNPQRWCFSFNYLMMLNRLELHSSLMNRDFSLQIMERSFYSTFHVFIRDSMNMGNLSSEEYLTLKGHFDLFSDPDSRLRRVSSLWPHVDLFLYIRVSPEIAMRRLKRRRRKEEKGIGVEFLRRLHELHDDYFLPGESGCNRDGIPVLVIENDANMTHDFCLDIVQQIARHPVVVS